MANTIIVPEIFAKEVVRNRDIKNVFYPYVNSAFTGELKKAGDTVHVQTLPTLSFASGTAGGPISESNFTITSESLVINTTKQLRITLKDIEMTQSNLELESKVAERFAEAEARLMDEAVRDQILVTQAADVEVLPAVASLGKANVFATIESMKVALAENNVTDGLVLFVAPKAASILRQSGLLDNSDLGLEVRTKGYMGMVSGVKVVETNALTSSKSMILMQDGAVNMVVQLNQYDVRQGTDGFYENLIAEVIYGLKIFGENGKAIAVQPVTEYGT